MVTKIREVTEKHNIVLILTKFKLVLHVQVKCLPFEHAGIEPDVVVMSKAVGGGLPLLCLVLNVSLMLGSQQVTRVLSVVTSWQWVQV